MRTSLYSLFLNHYHLSMSYFKWTIIPWKTNGMWMSCTICWVQEETRLKNQGSHVVHHVSHYRNQGVKNKFMKKHDKGKDLLKINETFMQIQKKASKSNNFHFCWKGGHFQKDCWTSGINNLRGGWIKFQNFSNKNF